MGDVDPVVHLDGLIRSLPGPWLRVVPFSSRSLVECLRSGAKRIGWQRRAQGRDGRWLTGMGVAASTYPARSMASTCTVRAEVGERYVVEINAADIGTGARTALTQIAADELRVPMGQVQVHIADSRFGAAMIAGGSMGTTSWGWAITKGCRELLASGRGSVTVDTADDVAAMAKVSRHAFGAQFAEVRVDPDSGEVRVPRLVGVFGVGRVVNAQTARSQLIGGMTMGLSMALHEESVLDARFGEWVDHDLAGYHIASNADIGEIDVSWVDEHDETVNPLGVKGIGEIGIVGTAAAITNAVYQATGTRIRELPLRLDRVLVPARPLPGVCGTTQRRPHYVHQP